MAKAYPVEEYVQLKDVVADLPGVSAVAARNWMKAGKYPAGIKRGKYWLVHPKQFRQWWADGGPNAR